MSSANKIIIPDFHTSQNVLNPDKYTYNRHGMRGSRVGQAALDILSKDNAEQSVEQTLDEYAPEYAKSIEECIETHRGKLKDPFYILVLTNKTPYIENVLRNYFIARQTPPYAFQLMEEYSNHTKTLYLVDSRKGQIKLLWSLPGFHDCVTVSKNPEIYSPELVKWIIDCFSNKLDRDSYSFD